MYKIKIMLLGLSLLIFSILLAIITTSNLQSISFYIGLLGLFLTIVGFFTNEKS